MALICLVLVSLAAACCLAADFYVKPDGNDDANGTTQATAWRSINRGDVLYALKPGDTVHVMTGNYVYTDANPGSMYDWAISIIRCAGTAGNPITYKAEGDVTVSMPSTNMHDHVFAISSDAHYTVLDGFKISGAWCIGIYAPGAEIKNCRINAGTGRAMYVSASSLIHHNLFLGDTGVTVAPGSDGTSFYNNTFSNTYWAVGHLPWDPSNRSLTLKNNIFANCGSTAVELPDASLTCSHNTFFNCTQGVYYIGGDWMQNPTGDGENTDDPLFAADYHLSAGSPCLDSGTNVGLPYSGTAPDRGAYEGAAQPASRDFYVKPDGDDNADGKTPATAWRSIDRGDVLYELQPGDTVHVMAGDYKKVDSNPGSMYDAMVCITRCGGTAERPITYRAEGDVTINFIASDQHDTTLRVDAPYIVIDGFRIGGGWNSIALFGSASGREVKNCRVLSGAGPVYIDGAANLHHNLFLNDACLRVGPGASGCAFYNNTFACKYWAVSKLPWESFSGNLTFKNNIFANCTMTAINLPDAVLSCSHNTFFNCTDGLYFVNGDWMDYPTGEGEDLNDPMFAADYHLSTGSPCVDSGADLGFAYSGAAPDRGAFEVPAVGSDAGTITGFVKEAVTGQAIEGAWVTVTIGGLQYSVQTGADGSFSVQASPGTQTVKASAALYNAQEQTVTVPANGTVSVNFDLTWGRDFYVRPDGDDNADGRTPANAWKTIGRGEALNVLQPGDTIHVMAGTYDLTDPTTDEGWGVGVVFNTAGAPGKPVTYKAEGEVRVVFHESATVPYETADYNYQDYVFRIKGDYVILDGFDISGCAWTDIFVDYVKGAVVRNCRLRDFIGVYVAETGDGCRVERNLFDKSCAMMEAGNADFYNNTFISPLKLDLDHAAGINEWPWGSHNGSITVKNNIFANIEGLGVVNGTKAAASMNSSHNTFYNCSDGAYYSGGVLHAAPVGEGENIGNPMFVGENDYRLSFGSPCIDSGAVVQGIDYKGSAPDRGAFETVPNPPVVTSKVGEALGLGEGAAVSLSTAVVTAGSGVFADNIIYVEDATRAAGIRVQLPQDAVPVDAGSRVKIDGNVVTQSGMKTIIASNIEYLDGGDELAPIGMIGKSVSNESTATIGLLIKTWGRVRILPGVVSYFCLDDGSGRSDGNGNAGVPIAISQTVGGVGTLPANGAYISVVGVVGMADLGGGLVPVVLPRGSTDLQ